MLQLNSDLEKKEYTFRVGNLIFQELGHVPLHLLEKFSDTENIYPVSLFFYRYSRHSLSLLICVPNISPSCSLECILRVISFICLNFSRTKHWSLASSRESTVLLRMTICFLRLAPFSFLHI